EAVRPGPHRPEGEGPVALLRGVGWRQDREVDEAVEQRGVRLARHQVDRQVVDHVDPADLGDVGAVRRLLLRGEHPLDGAERRPRAWSAAAWWKTPPRRSLTGPGRSPPARHDSASWGTMRLSASRPTSESNMLTPTAARIDARFMVGSRFSGVHGSATRSSPAGWAAGGSGERASRASRSATSGRTARSRLTPPPAPPAPPRRGARRGRRAAARTPAPPSSRAPACGRWRRAPRPRWRRPGPAGAWPTRSGRRRPRRRTAAGPRRGRAR